MVLDYKFILLLITTAVNLLLAFYVYSKNPKNKVNISFALVVLSSGLWAFTNAVCLKVTTLKSAIFWSQISYISAILIAASFLYFSLVFPARLSELKKFSIRRYHKVYIFFSVLLISIITIIPNFTIKNIVLHPWQIITGPGLYIFGPYFLGTMGWAFWNLIRKYLISQGIEKTQIQYLFIGSLLSAVFGSIFNLILPMGGNYQFVWLGPIFTFIMIGTISYAIIRYRLMDIRVVAGRTVVYVLSFGTVILFGLGLNFGNLKIGQPISMAVLGPLTLVLGIILYQVVFRLYEKLASRYFYYTFYSYQKVLTDLGKNLTKILDLDKLSSLIVNTLIETMKLDKTVILLRQPETGNYQIKKNIGFREENGISLVKDDFLTQYLEKTQKPLVYEELAMMIRDSKDNWEKSKFEDLRIKMKKIEAALCLPLLVEEKIIGLIVLGNKISGDPYSFQDIELLTALSNQSAVGLQNARLYSQVEDLSKTLAIRVEAQTKELRTAYEELKALDKAKSEFISMASHQLRTPLTAMKGYLSLLLEGKWLDNPKERKEKLQNLFISNERLIRIVNDLMNVSKIELGRMEMDWEKSQLEDLIQSVYEELKIEADKKNLKMIFQKPKKLLPKVTIDVLKIRQVIINLIDNAIKYTQKGKIEIGLKKTNSSILFWVKDTGEGLTDKEEKDIFQGFVRGSAGLTHFVQGAGLGLYVAKKFLELHKAKIWAESPGRGKGSTFYVELPIE